MKNLDIVFKEKFRLEELIIKKLDYWIVSLRPQQVTIGSLVLTLNRHCKKFSEILPEEARDLEVAFKVIELLFEDTFKPDKINYLALMMKDAQVHFHIIPRYKDVRNFQGVDYTDKFWPQPPDLRPMILSNNTIMEILQYMKR